MLSCIISFHVATVAIANIKNILLNNFLNNSEFLKCLNKLQNHPCHVIFNFTIVWGTERNYAAFSIFLFFNSYFYNYSEYQVSSKHYHFSQYSLIFYSCILKNSSFEQFVGNVIYTLKLMVLKLCP